MLLSVKRKASEMDAPEAEAPTVTNVAINSCFLDSSFVDSFSNAFVNKEAKSFENGAHVIADPFVCCSLRNFCIPDEFLRKVKRDVRALDMTEKDSDLYQYKQSRDIRSCVSGEFLKKFRAFLCGDVLAWIQNVTRIALSDTVDVSCSLYRARDYLSCHDDKLQGRRIAFIYYLVPPWERKDGGTLDLFSVVNGEPNEIRTSIVPAWNNFVFFEVTPISYHQVSEVLCNNKSRRAISGWFHDLSGENVPVSGEICLLRCPSVPGDLASWISDKYLDAETQMDVREYFEDSSQIELFEFIRVEKFAEVSQALLHHHANWARKGPCNKRCYEEAENAELPAIVRECIDVLNSEAMLLLLSNITGLDLHKNSIEDNTIPMGKSASYVRRWRHRSYTLLYEGSCIKKSLDTSLYLNCDGWCCDCGGYAVFYDDIDQSEIIRTHPRGNSFSLVYVDVGVSRFVKYVNRMIKARIPHQHFHEIRTLYQEGEI